MNIKFLAATLLITSFTFDSCADSGTNSNEIVSIIPPDAEESKKIQVAILLDTSGSMDGLIEQAKSRLWNIVNTLTTLKFQGKTPIIEIALYEYGNSGLSVTSNYIRQISALTTDLDLISEKLFALRTNGGDEYCGAVIQDATKQLMWGKGLNDMKLIYIAGNEPFNQGTINYKEAVSDALKNDIYVNTIFCGNQMEGITTFWKDGADKGQGKFFTINSNEEVMYVQTPYDDQILKCNERLNSTYIGYGRQGELKKSNQIQQDKNAESVSSSNYTERTVSKSKAVYKNESWDLVDKVKEDKEAVKKISKDELPIELKDKSTEEIEVFVREKSVEREKIQSEIGELGKKRQAYIDNEMKKNAKPDDLGGAIKNSILEFSKNKGYTAE